MKLKNLLQNSLLLFTLAAALPGCSRLLDEKSDMRLTTPETLEDNQALLDRVTDALTGFSMSGMASSDEYYITDADYNALQHEENKRLYTWQPDHVAVSRTEGNDWSSAYRAILIANTVLFNLDHYNIPNAGNVRGQALVLRAIRYLDAAQTWCPAYNPATAVADLGLPLRLDPDMNRPSVRASVKETYDRILADLTEATALLPVQQVAATRPSKTAAHAYLARTFLLMGDYPKALENAMQVLQYPNALMDYNILNPAASYPIKNMNSEVLLRATISTGGPTAYNISKVPAEIYSLYEANDLRKTVFFKINPDQSIFFKGNYTASPNGRLAGVALDEVYLIIAECYARLGNTSDALQYLNALLVKRWKAGTFVPLQASTPAQALELIKVERKKELLFRGIRWMDLKRYNRDGAGINLSRTVLGKTYTLPANDPRWAIALPEDIVAQTGMPQNPR
ncbi:MAG: RagB/SusD family nutrient uptake outer membrane protein [Chryseobacterium sp.]|nr:MAG: RagB/SusD family nutrient uptake outer membrane protein [Chryseobacterium sp.]